MELSLFENYSHSSYALSFENNGTYFKKQAKEQVCLYPQSYKIIHNEKKMKMEKKSLRYDKNKGRSRHGHKYSKYKTCMMMLICIKQHLSNT